MKTKDAAKLVCSRCGQEQLAAEFPLRRHISRHGCQYGYYTYRRQPCRACQRRAYARLPEHPCAGCGQTVSGRATYCSPKCRHKATYIPSPRTVLEKGELARRKRERAKLRMARLRADPVTGPAVRVADRERLEAWRAAHPDYRRERQRVRGHIRYRADMPKHFSPKNYLTQDQWENIVAAFGGKCAYCDQVAELVRDHVIPIAGGGKHVAENIVPSCRPCNEKKCAQDVRAWLNDEDRYQFIGDMVASYA